MTDSIPPKGPEDAPNEGAGKPEALEVTQHADHPLEAELRDPAAGKPASVSAPAASASAGGWEREVLEKVLMATVREQRAARRWRITGAGAPLDVWYSAEGEWLGLDASVAGGRKLSYRFALHAHPYVPVLVLLC